MFTIYAASTEELDLCGRGVSQRTGGRIRSQAVDSGENVVVLIPDDDGVFYMANAGYVGEHRMPCTQPVQTYVDVFHCGGRGQEAAEAALEQRRKPERKQRGLL
jgi:hypothetical protein